MATISESLQEVMKIEGAMAAAIVDGTTGMCLGTASREEMDMEVAAAGDTEVFRSKLRALEQQGRAAVIEEITITLPKELHIIKTLARDRNLFLYLLLDRHGCNQALAMRKLANVERDLDV
ncbi:MAG TPA: hypothetical protein VGE52_06015 [Pirellulales bacterium]